VPTEKPGADVTLLERTDMLLGTGLVGGIFRNNGPPPPITTIFFLVILIPPNGVDFYLIIPL